MSDDKLLPLRQKIDAIDAQILDLLNQRALVAEEVGHIKAVTNAPVFRPEREAHAESAHQHRGLLAFTEPPAGERGQCLFGAVHTARHQRLAVGQDHEFVPVTGERQRGAVRCARLAE